MQKAPTAQKSGCAATVWWVLRAVSWGRNSVEQLSGINSNAIHFLFLRLDLQLPDVFCRRTVSR
jgi:hypothetical protein